MGTALNLVGVLEIAIFCILALLHFFWAIRGKVGNSVAIPQKDGQPLFKPGRVVTVIVGLALLLCAIIIAGFRNWIGDGIPPNVWKIGMAATAFAFGMRAIGDFRFVGFFKTRREGPFAFWDYVLFSPLCTAISAGAIFLFLNQ